MNWRRIRKCLLILVTLGGILLCGAAWIIGGGLVAPANRVVGPPPADFPAETVSISSDSGAILAGWYLPVTESTSTVILLHPIRGDRRSMLSRARLLRGQGYSTLLIDFQAHGESGGANVTVGYLEKHDVVAAVQFVRERTPNQKIAIVGRSLGGAATLFAQPKVDAIVLESVYPTLSEAVHNRVQMRLGLLHHIVAPLLLLQLKPRLGISPHQLRPIDQLEQIKIPILIAVGNCDKHTTIDETRRIFNKANEPKRLVIFDGARHEDLLAFDSEKYRKDVIRFLDENLASERNRDK